MDDSITLQANRSGQLWTADPGAWARLCTSSGCPVCDGPPLPEWILAETPILWVTAQSEAPLPGYVCLACKRHVVEPYELSPQEQAEFWQDSMLAAQGLANAVRPVKMNYEIHGNTIPHLHMHLFPRMRGDVYVGYMIHCRAQFTRSQEKLQEIGRSIRVCLAEHNRLVK